MESLQTPENVYVWSSGASELWEESGPGERNYFPCLKDGKAVYEAFSPVLFDPFKDRANGRTPSIASDDDFSSIPESPCPSIFDEQKFGYASGLGAFSFSPNTGQKGDRLDTKAMGLDRHLNKTLQARVQQPDRKTDSHPCHYNKDTRPGCKRNRKRARSFSIENPISRKSGLRTRSLDRERSFHYGDSATKHQLHDCFTDVNAIGSATDSWPNIPIGQPDINELPLDESYAPNTVNWRICALWNLERL